MEIVEHAPLVGRAEALKALDATLGAGAKLVTVTGPAGVGKSRLLEVAGQRLAAAGRDVAALDLTDVATMQGLASATAAALGLGELDDDGERRLGRALEDRGELTLVVDHGERVAEALREAVGLWQRMAPSLSVVLGSRMQLGARGEVVQELAPLQPDEAVELWSRAVDRVGGRSEPAIAAAIVERLDRLPLAIELAAARTRILGERELLERIEESLDLLGGGSRSLEHSLRLSWDLLSAGERRALSHCTVFHGTFDVTAVEAVVGREVEPGLSTLEATARLRAASLLDGRDHPLLPGRLRLRVLRSIQDFVQREAAPPKEARDRHAAHYAGLSEREVATEEIVASYANVIAAAEHGLKEGTADGLVTSMRALQALHRVQGRSDSMLGVRPLVDQALASPHIEAVPESMQAFTLLQLCEALFAKGDGEATRRKAARARELARAAEDRLLEGRAASWLGLVERFWGDADRALELLEEGQRLARETADRWWELSVVVQIGHHRMAQGHHDEAMAQVLAALAEARADAVRYPLQEYGLAYALGHQERRHAEDAVALARRLGMLRDEAQAMTLLVAHELEAGQLQAARDTAAQALALNRELTNKVMIPQALIFVAATQLAGGEDEAARATLEEAAALLRSQGRSLTHALAGLAIAGDEGALEALRQVAGDPSEQEQRRLILAWGAGEPLPETRGLHARTTRAVLMARALSAGADRIELEVASDGSWFARVNERVDVSKRRAPTRILAALVGAYLEDPAREVLVEELVAAGWPGEKILAEAGKKRLYVAISTLRKLGLGELLIRGEDGYRFAPGVRLTAR